MPIRLLFLWLVIIFGVTTVYSQKQQEIQNQQEKEIHQRNLYVSQLYRAGNMEQAFRWAVDTREKARVLGQKNPYYLRAITNLAVVYEYQKKDSKAETLYIECRKHSEEPCAATINLAGLFRRQGKYAKAQKLYAVYLKAAKEKWGKDHPYALLCMNNLGMIYTKLSMYLQAEAMFKECLEIRRRTLGENHPDTLQTMMNLAMVYMELRQYGKTKVLLQNVEKKQSYIPPDHLATLLNNLALLYGYQGKYKQAENLYQRSLKLTKDNATYATTLNNLATLYEYMGKNQQAENYYLRSLQLAQNTLSSLDAMNNLAMLYLYQKKLKKAEDILQKYLFYLPTLTTNIASKRKTDQKILPLHHYQVRKKKARSFVACYKIKT